VLVQKVAESLVREFLKIHHAVACQQVEGLPGCLVELNPLARHHITSARLSLLSP
jgi:hypothetical protein